MDECVSGECVCDHAEFQLTEESGLALRYTTKKGVTQAPNRMPSLSEDSEDSLDATRKYLESYKKCRLCACRWQARTHCTLRCCRFWTTIELTPGGGRNKA